jgi:tetratricopeptide (TPR) repeat protein
MTQTRRARRGAQGHRPLRLWCLPPAILRELDETLEGWHILREHDGELAAALWFAFRDVSLWASVPVERRTGLFTASALRKRLELVRDCAADAGVAVHLAVLASVVDNAAPADPKGVSAACSAVSQWAAARGATGTAVAFAQAGALTVPADAAAASAVGRLTVRWGRMVRAETWLRRAIGLARRAGDWYTYAEACVELGDLYRRKRLAEQSHRYFVLAARACRRHGYTQVRAAALHGLSRLYKDEGNLEDAERHAHMALRAYGRKHPAFRAVMHDLAEVLVAKESYGRAIPVLRRLLGDVPANPAFTLALIAHAAAATGERRLYEEAWSKAWALLDELAEGDQASRALLQLIRAAARLEDWLRVSLVSRRYAEKPESSRNPCDAKEMADLAALAGRRAPEGA